MTLLDMLGGTWLGVVPLNATHYVDQNGTRLNYTNVNTYYNLGESDKPVEVMPTSVAILHYIDYINGQPKSGFYFFQIVFLNCTSGSSN